MTAAHSTPVIAVAQLSGEPTTASSHAPGSCLSASNVRNRCRTDLRRDGFRLNEVTWGRRWRTIARVTSGHSVFEQANDRFTYKTGYLPVDGTKLSVKDRFRMGRSGTPYPLWSFAQQT